MENTRTTILDILRGGEATIEELITRLALAPATVRRHLDILQRDGFVQVRAVRRETGRPHYAYSLTKSGEEAFPHHYMRLTSRLLGELRSLTPEDTAGLSGADLSGLLFERLADELVAEYGPRVKGQALDKRLDQALEALAGEGLLFEVRPEGNDYVLLGRDCPCRALDEDAPACRFDTDLLARLLDADVQRLAGPGGCAYLVHAAL